MSNSTQSQVDSHHASVGSQLSMATPTGITPSTDTEPPRITAAEYVEADDELRCTATPFAIHDKPDLF